MFTSSFAYFTIISITFKDGHEICFVGDEAFRELSAVDPKAAELLDKAIEEDGSIAWYNKKGQTKRDA